MAGNTRKIIGVVVGVVVLVLVVVVLGVMLGQGPHGTEIGLTTYPSNNIVYQQLEDSPYATQINEFFKKQSKIINKYNLTSCDPVTKPENFCSFQPHWLGGIKACTEEEHWGFNSNSPCLLIAPNKVPDWIPDVYTELEDLPDNMPQSLKDKILQLYKFNSNEIPKFLWVSCDAKKDTDNASFDGRVSLGPWQGIASYYFPYQVNDSYIQPVVGLHVSGLKKGVPLTIECRLWTKDIITEDNVQTIHITME